MTLPESAPVPRTFLQYLRSFGPGLVIVLTWLGAGDIVDIGVNGGNYGYSLMWVVVLAVFMRFLFVSIIAKYQLCNQHGEGVLDGLGRLHRAYPPFLALSAIIMGHIYGAYMTLGIGESCVNLFGWGKTWHWAVFCNGVALIFVFRANFQRVEWVFKCFLAVLSVSFIGTAIWVGPDVAAIGRGLVSFSFPDQQGNFEPLLVAIALIGAVGGSLMNMVYPYFLEAKGWHGPLYRRVQMYDFLLAVTVMVILNLSIWVLGAQVLYPQGLKINVLDDLPRLLTETVVGHFGRVLFYIGIFAALFTSVIGHALGLACLGTHGFLRWRAGNRPVARSYQHHWLYKLIAVWCLVSPLVWTFKEKTNFVQFTLVSNSLQVVLIPILAGGLWCITASSRYIGAKHRNRWWENLFLGLLFALAIWGAWGAVDTVTSELWGG